jgi:glucose-1-phosphate cytidylyltransferase
MAKDPSTGPVSVGHAEGNVRMVNLPEEGPVIAESPKPVKTVIWAGRRGTRLQDVTKGKIPKPMVEIGGIPLLEHIIRIYSSQGFREFIIAVGSLGYIIEEWVESHPELGDWADDVKVIDTGVDTQTGGRLLRLREHLADDPFFMLTYGDGVADVNLAALIEFHQNLAVRIDSPAVTLTAANPPARFGNMEIEDGYAVKFGEKSQLIGSWINAGFYVVDPGILHIIPGVQCSFEYDILPILAIQHRLGAFQHPGYFQMVDTFRDMQQLQQVWDSGVTPWARWEK